MIPVRLTLHNFLSYGDAVEPIDFSELRVVCLSGSNGHGKSALLDAMTWALWGQARATSVDDLVRLGQNAMRVEFEFDFDGHRYRVLRKRSRGRTGQSDLQFQIRLEDDSFQTLTEQGVRATQERINQTLRMDYETFINSAFILQGRADEFARKGALDRKRILSEILNLGAYDELVEEARLRARDAEERRRALDEDLQRIDAELAEEPKHQAQIEHWKAALAEIQERQQEREAELKEWTARKVRLTELQTRHEGLERALKQAETDLSMLRAQRDAAQTRVLQARALLEEGESIRQQVAQLKFARQQEKQMADRLSTLRRLEGEAKELETAVLRSGEESRVQLELAREQVRAIKAREVQLPSLVQEEEELEGQIRVLDRLEEAAERAQEQSDAARERRATLVAERQQWQQTLEDADDRFQFLKRAEARCPVCEGELKAEQRLELGRKLRREREELQLRIEAAEKECSELDLRISALKRQVDDAARKRRLGQGMRDRLAQARQSRNQIEESLKTLPQATSLVEQLEARIAAGEFAPEQRRRLAALQEQMRALGYDEEEHRGIQDRIAELQPAQAKMGRLEAAEENIAKDEEQAQSLTALVESREESLGRDRKAADELKQEVAALPEVRKRQEEMERDCRRIQGEADAAQGALGGAQSRVDRCKELKQTAAQKRAERNGASRDKTNYDELARIFGKNGIQALIIENAIPEIEMEANAILERMTDNGMKVAFMTQRDTKTAGVAETLDIEISDQMGTRKYELYSGGEALRANFAIRVALSKLLARRAGARLQMLVIDEGFGSQDAEGRERLIDAIHSVQDEFEKILVITHLDELKDAFPARIEVTKDHRGSRATVMV